MNSRHATRFGYVALFGLLQAVVQTFLGHFHPDAGLTPFTSTISDYAAADRAGSVEVGIFLAGLAAFPLMWAMRNVGAPLSRLTSVLFGLWGAGLVVTAIVPTDPLGHTTMSTAGYVHRYASTLAFAAMIVAGIVLSVRVRHHESWRDLRYVLSGLSAVAVACGAMVTWTTYVGGRVLIGFGERVLAAAMLGMLIVLAVRVIQLRPVREFHEVAPVAG